MKEKEFTQSKNLFHINAAKESLLKLVPLSDIDSGEYDTALSLIRKWEHNAFKSFDVDEDNADFKIGESDSVTISNSSNGQ